MSLYMEHRLMERDVETPTVEVSALDTHIVEDGDAIEARHLRTEHAACFCEDGRHRNEDHDDLQRERRPKPAAAHRITAHVYAYFTEEQDA